MAVPCDVGLTRALYASFGAGMIALFVGLYFALGMPQRPAVFLVPIAISAAMLAFGFRRKRRVIDAVMLCILALLLLIGVVANT